MVDGGEPQDRSDEEAIAGAGAGRVGHPGNPEGWHDEGDDLDPHDEHEQPVGEEGRAAGGGGRGVGLGQSDEAHLVGEEQRHAAQEPEGDESEPSPRARGLGREGVLALVGQQLLVSGIHRLRRSASRGKPVFRRRASFPRA